LSTKTTQFTWDNFAKELKKVWVSSFGLMVLSTWVSGFEASVSAKEFWFIKTAMLTKGIGNAIMLMEMESSKESTG
jgi:hypothetical protein